MGKAKPAAPKKTQTPLEAALETPTATSTPAATPATTTNKSEAVRAAIAAGVDKPKAGCEWIKTHYGLDVKETLFSAIKNTEKKKGNVQTHTGRRTTKAPATNDSPAKLAFEVKTLIDNYGMAEVKRMVEAADLFLGVQ